MSRNNLRSAGFPPETVADTRVDKLELALVEVAAESCARRDAVAPAVRGLALERAGRTALDDADGAVLH